ASAVAAVPAEGRNWAYISSGTWSLMGVERDAPLLTDEALQLNFTNEGGVGGATRFLKNITGLWLLQQCREAWKHARRVSYEELLIRAESTAPFRSLVDPDHQDFLHPASMPDAIARFCVSTKQAAPETPGEFARAVFESLALKYRYVLDQLRTVVEHPIERIHVIGGGSLNRLLCQWTADATGLPVFAGPVEATAIGNLMVQAMAIGAIDSLKSAREVIRRSFKPIRFEPRNARRWEAPYRQFADWVEGS
ncbi:MAG: rhamnulokinase, partial [Planctomycetes bacterium]|nr:rhamnulokinase [Planctomycetota bacterium]